MSTLIYLDRGVISSAAVSGTPGTPELAGSGLQGDFDVDYYAYGLLQAAFMFGLLLGCPVFSALAKTANPFRLIAVGLGAWTVAVLGCAAAPNYASLFVARALVGVGEASFVSLAAPFIDDVAPKNVKHRGSPPFTCAFPSGSRWIRVRRRNRRNPRLAMGVRVRGGGDGARRRALRRVAPDSHQRRGRGRGRGWSADRSAADRSVADVDPRPSSTFDPDAATPLALARAFARDATAVLRRRTFFLVVLGYVFYTAVIGVYAVWGPKAGYAVFAESLHSPARSDVVFGGVTVAAGATGTVLGPPWISSGASVEGAARVCALADAPRVRAPRVRLRRRVVPRVRRALHRG